MQRHFSKHSVTQCWNFLCCFSSDGFGLCDLWCSVFDSSLHSSCDLMTIYHPLRKSEEAAEQNDDDDDDDGGKARIPEIVRESSSKSDAPLANLCFSCPVCQQSFLSTFTGSPHYSEDFEEDDNPKEPQEEVRIWKVIKVKLNKNSAAQLE